MPMGRLLVATMLLLALPLLSVTAGAEELAVRIRAPQGKVDMAHQYYRDLLAKALEAGHQAGEPRYKVEVTDLNVTQTRALFLLQQGHHIDVDWAGTNQAREADLRPIRIPLNMGLLGVRLLVIRRSDLPKFRAITQPEELKTLVACQGGHWPDSDILEANGYLVLRINRFEQMWRMLRGKRCDYFPRSIIEGYGEIRSYGGPDLVVMDQLLLHYPFPMFFFVSKSHEGLARTLERGLERLIAQGGLQRYMAQHPATGGAFPLHRYLESRVFRLENKDLSPEDRQLPEHFWLTFKDEPS